MLLLRAINGFAQSIDCDAPSTDPIIAHLSIAIAQPSVDPGILNTWIGNEADIRYSKFLSVLRLRAILRVAKLQKGKATLDLNTLNYTPETRPLGSLVICITESLEFHLLRWAVPLLLLASLCKHYC